LQPRKEPLDEPSALVSPQAAAATHKTLVIGAVEVLSYEDKKGTHCAHAGRVRLSTLDDAGGVSMRHFLTHNIDAGSTLRTDGWRGYSDAGVRSRKMPVGDAGLFAS